MNIKNILSIVLLTFGLSQGVTADEWIFCNGCSDYQKEQKAKQFNSELLTMVYIMDKTNETVTTYEVQTYFEEEGRRFRFISIANKKESTQDVIEASKNSFLFLHENNDWRFDAYTLGTPYQNAGFLVNSRNAADVANLIATRIKNSTYGNSGINQSEKLKGSFLSAVKSLRPVVIFPDLSQAIFELSEIGQAIDQNGNPVPDEYFYDFKVKQLLDKDGKVLPMNRDSLRGMFVTISNAAAGTWQTTFNVLGVAWSYSGSGNGSSYRTTCTMSADDHVVCTLVQSN